MGVAVREVKAHLHALVCHVFDEYGTVEPSGVVLETSMKVQLAP